MASISSSGSVAEDERRVNRYELAAALIEYDEPSTSEGPKLAFQSAILSPFRHILRPPPVNDFVGSQAQNALPSPLAPNGQRDSSVTGSISDGGRTSLLAGRKSSAGDDLHSRYAKTLGGSQIGPENREEPHAATAEEDPEEEEKLVDSWGLSEMLSQLSSPTFSVGGKLEYTIPSSAAIGASNPLYESSGIPLERTRSNPERGNDYVQIRGPRLRILERSVSENRTGIALELPTFESLLPGAFADEPLSATALSRPNSALSLSSQMRPSSAAAFHRPMASRTYRVWNISDTLTRPAKPEIAAPPILTSLPPFSDDRPLSSFSIAPTPFTSRFDPAMLAIARQEIESERPVFKNKTAGAPPKLVVMPYPLSDRPLSPPPAAREEGPDPESDDEGSIEVLRDDDGNIIQNRPQRPAGVLYGRSLLDVLAERKAAAKSRARHHNPAQDGRRPMADWGDSPAALTLANAEAEADDERIIPLKVPRVMSTMSIFGPDLLYQRDMRTRLAIEKEEALERAEEDRKEAEVWEKERLKQEKKALKRRKYVARDEAARKLEGKTQPASQTEQEVVRALPSSAARQPASPPQRRHTVAPSISMPAGLAQDNDSAPWFHSPSPRSASSGSSISQPAPNQSYPPPAPIRPSTRKTYAEDEASKLRAAVMHGTLSASEAIAESTRLGLGKQSSASEEDQRPLGERLSHYIDASVPPRPDFHTHRQMSFSEKVGLDGLSGKSTPPLDDDDVPLGLRVPGFGTNNDLASTLRLEDDEDTPLGLRFRSKAEVEDYEDDRPLGLSAPLIAARQLQQRMQQQNHLSSIYIQAQLQQQQAMLTTAQQTSLAGQMSFAHASGLESAAASGGHLFNLGTGGAVAQVERWRRSVA